MKAPAQPDNLRRLTRLLGGGIIFAGVTLIAIIAFAGWSANQSAVERDKTLVQNALNQSVARILSEQKSIAWWDDAVSHISKEFDPEWTRTEFGIFLNETYSHDEVYIFDGSDQLIYSFREGEDVAGDLLRKRLAQIVPIVSETRTGKSAGLAERVDAFGKSQQNYEVMSGVLDCARWRGHILSIDGRPAVVTGITICPSVDFKNLLQLSPALLVSVVFIDDAFMGEMGRSLLLPDLKLTSSEVHPFGMVRQPFITDDGARGGYLSWTPRQPGRVLLTIILPLVSIGVIGAGMLLSALLRRLRTASAALAEREESATYQSMHDSLSGLPNRHQFVRRMREALAEVKARPGQRLTVAYIDVDRFKDTNDTLGHHAGDELIKAVGIRLGQQLSDGDLLARFGGDEFAILRTRSGVQSDAEWIDSVMAAFDESFPLLGQNLLVTASIGVAAAPAHGDTPDELMRNADIALYAAKAGGRDRAVFFSPEMADEVQHRRTIEMQLRDAISANQLSLHYQPIVSCETNAVTGLEALLRWRHPEEGDISPAVFIPIAEQSGIMPALGAWVLERAFEDAQRWPDLDVAVNLSPAQFHNVDLELMLRNLLTKYAIDPKRIILEITEGLLLESSPRVTSTMQALRRMGFKTALNDFGTGFSSLNYLHAFEFDKLKIDRSFLRSLSRTSKAKTIVQTVIRLGRSLGMDVIAEGVETESEAAMMRLFGCTAMQGFLFSKAVPPEEIADLRASIQALDRPVAEHDEALGIRLAM